METQQVITKKKFFVAAVLMTFFLCAATLESKAQDCVEVSDFDVCVGEWIYFTVQDCEAYGIYDAPGAILNGPIGQADAMYYPSPGSYSIMFATSCCGWYVFDFTVGDCYAALSNSKGAAYCTVSPMCEETSV